MTRKKIVITETDNGYIVKVVGQGKSELQTRYISPLYVFEDMAGLRDWIEKFFNWRGKRG